MSWGTCYNGSNNIHFNYPAIMTDARLFSQYESGASFDNELKKKNNIMSNSDYRHYLQKNADLIIKNNQLKACDECSNCPYVPTSLKTSNSPYLFDSNLTNNQPFGYETSDLKNIYLSKEQLQSKLKLVRFNIN